MGDALTARANSAVGSAIAQARQECEPRLTQAELARRTNGLLSRSSIANIESGRQRIAVHHLYLIADALGISPQSLLPAPEEILSRVEPDLEDVAETDPEATAWLRRALG